LPLRGLRTRPLRKVDLLTERITPSLQSFGIKLAA
jgi:hypothetical protein